MLTINNNSQNQIYGLSQTSNTQQKLINQLASGVISNADNPSGMSIVNSMLSQLNGNTMGMQNANDGMSMIQTADSATTSITDLLQQQRDLAVQSMNGTYNPQNLADMNTQYQQLTAQIDQIATTTSFNGTPLMANLSPTGVALNGTQPPVNINTNNGTTNINLANFSTSTTGGVFGATPFNTTDISNSTNAQNAISSIDSALTTINTVQSGFGATQNALLANASNLADYNVNLMMASSQIQDTNYAKASTELSKQNVLQQAKIAMLSHANVNQQSVLSLLK